MARAWSEVAERDPSATDSALCYLRLPTFSQESQLNGADERQGLEGNGADLTEITRLRFTLT
jgi:hypothetical protein